MLKTAAIMQFLLAAGHLLCLFRLDAAFRFYHIEPYMDALAGVHPALPAAITVAIACGLAGCGLYALSADGALPRLPLLRPAIYAIAALFLTRGLLGFVLMAAAGQAPASELTAAVISTAIGLLYLLGGLRALRSSSIAHAASR